MERTNQKYFQVLFGFILSLLLTLIFPIVVPWCKLLFFAPFLVMSFYKVSFRASLGWAVGSGFLMDLFSSHQHLALYALNYGLTVMILYYRKQHFFPENISTIPSFTFLFSFISTMLQTCLLYLFEKGIPISRNWILTDLLLYPLIDAAYAFVLFALFPFLMPKAQKKEYFFKTSASK